MIEIYTKNNCNYCVKTKNILKSLNVSFVEHVVEVDVTRDFIINKFPNARSYPVIVINNEFIGGLVEFESYVLEHRENVGKLFLVE